MDFEGHTAFVGGNGAGKSSVLRALERFYATTRTLDADDYFGRDQSIPVEIELTFGSLSDEELATFESRVRDGKLTVTRVFDTSPSTGSYYGSVLQNRDFLPIRAQQQAMPKRQAYNELRATATYQNLPAVSSAPAVDEALVAWESANTGALTLERDDGRFFGFQNAGRGALQRHTSFVFVPAVREAAIDATDGKSSAIGRLLEILVRSSILRREEVLKLQAEMQERYNAMVSPDQIPELAALAETLTTGIKELYGSAAVGLDWREMGEIVMPVPAAAVSLSDDGFGGPVDRQGHGLQRAFIFTILQHLAKASLQPPAQSDETTAAAAPSAAPSLILAIEEPELYQHPTKQRHLAKVLRRLSSGTLPGTQGGTQIAFASHSPMFVSLAHSGEIRLVRRTDCDDSDFKQCEIKALDLTEVAAKLATACGKEAGAYTAASLAPRLHILGPELAEGFFANGIVLVEGRSDRAALFAIAKRLSCDFEAAGIAILPVEGKSNLDRPYLIFRELGIPVYIVWDCDVGTKEYKSESNLNLLRLVRPGEAVTAPEATIIEADYACFGVSLEALLDEELTTEVRKACLAAACEPLEISPSKEAQKIPDVMYQTLVEAAKQERTSPTLEKLVLAIWAHLVGGGPPTPQPVSDTAAAIA